MFMRPILAAALSLLPLAAMADGEKPRQLVIISFDGAHDNALWARSRKLAKKTGAHFTYFLSCTYLVNPADRHAYRAPGQKAGRSATGWAQSVPEIQARLGHIWQAHLEGHDIGSHACGHFDGGKWTKVQWSQEFRDFDSVLLNAWKNNDFGVLEPAGWADFVRNGIKGFRAPYLSTGPGLTAALKARGFTYDASLISKGPARVEDDGGLLRFALPRIPEGPDERLVIGMDYNLFVRHSGGLNAPARAAQFEARTLDAFRQAFERQYDGGRVPLQLGFHFVEMNGGAYWNALDTFLTETCGKPDVACVSYAQAIAMMKEKA
ncbi:MAG: polysaccharide deacetylase, partial [Rhizobiaceae bacterium]|nr:polysaccharide deacetylase [Rhizobiaceae bacterium]